MAYNDVTKRAIASIDLRKATAVVDLDESKDARSPGSVATVRSTFDDGECGGTNVDRAFRLHFAADDITFYADTDQEKADWYIYPLSLLLIALTPGVGSTSCELSSVGYLPTLCGRNCCSSDKRKQGKHRYRPHLALQGRFLQYIPLPLSIRTLLIRSLFFRISYPLRSLVRVLYLSRFPDIAARVFAIMMTISISMKLLTTMYLCTMIVPMACHHDSCTTFVPWDNQVGQRCGYTWMRYLLRLPLTMISSTPGMPRPLTRYQPCT